MKVSQAWTLQGRGNIGEGNEGVGVGTNAVFNRGYSVVKSLVPGVGHEPNTSGHTISYDTHLSAIIDQRNDVRSKPECTNN